MTVFTERKDAMRLPLTSQEKKVLGFLLLMVLLGLVALALRRCGG